MRSSSDLFKKGIMAGYTTQPNVKLNSDTIKDAINYTQAVEGETIEATGAASAGAFSAPLFTKEETKENKDKIPGGVSKGMTLRDIARKHAYDDSKDSTSKDKIEDTFQRLKKQLVKGVKVELEHTDNIKVAMEIAKDHLSEDPNYYTKLSKVESNEGEVTKIEATEATGSGSVGAYETPAFLAKNSKNWRGGKKPLYKGGKFVKVKKKCLTFPYCNQGAGAVKIFENESFKEAVSNASKKMGVDEEIIKRVLYYNLNKKKKK